MDFTTPEDLIAGLVAARRARKLSQRDVGEAVGVTAESVGYWERHRSRPAMARMRKWADLLKVAVPPAAQDWFPASGRGVGGECGTPAGYSRHRRRGGAPKDCMPCWDANRKYHLESRARKASAGDPLGNHPDARSGAGAG